jgi:hypothetical protein
MLNENATAGLLQGGMYLESYLNIQSTYRYGMKLISEPHPNMIHFRPVETPIKNSVGSCIVQ